MGSFTLCGKILVGVLGGLGGRDTRKRNVWSGRLGLCSGSRKLGLGEMWGRMGRGGRMAGNCTGGFWVWSPRWLVRSFLARSTEFCLVCREFVGCNRNPLRFCRHPVRLFGSVVALRWAIVGWSGTSSNFFCNRFASRR